MLKTMIGMAACGAAAVFGTAAAADTVSFTLNNPVQSVPTSGGRLSFTATVSAPISNASTEYLNGDSFNINPANAFDLDDDGFFSGFPLFLAPGDSYTGTFFALDVPTGSKAQGYTGTLSLLGGASPDSLDTLGTATFAVDVTSVAAAVPEPATWGMMILGFGVVGCAMRRQGRRSQVSVDARIRRSAAGVPD